MKKIFLFLLALAPLIVLSQEVLTGLHLNPVLKNNSAKKNLLKSNIIYDTLPFIDDFSKSNIYPDPSHWINRNVYINNDYGKNPATIGVATFDALDADGKIYKNANFDKFSADTLLSVNLKLDSIYTKGQKSIAIKKSDSLYFSFLYQPGGLGEYPDKGDSLVLEFYSPFDNKWHWAWHAKGSSFELFKAYLDSGKYRPIKPELQNFDTTLTFYKLDSVLHNKFNINFKVVYVPINDSVRYYHKGFKFRFRNYASIADSYLPAWGAGNVDIWNIDYVYINVGRRINETTLPNDVGFYKKSTTFLKNYQSMPWIQYLAAPTSERVEKLEFSYSSFINKELNVDQRLIINDLSKVNAVFKTAISTNGNMPPISDTTFIPQTGIYTFPDNHKNTCEFEILAYIKANLQERDVNPENDTVRFRQTFDNYYAYDDGNPEAGYGLGSVNDLIAYRFELNKTDTLRSVAIFFNSVKDNYNHKAFSIMVWDADANGKPKSAIDTTKSLMPANAGFDIFSVYHLDKPLILPSNKQFFIGIKQSTKDNLNIGFDFNNNNQSKLFYFNDINRAWSNSIYSGSLMIRPVFGKYLSEGINEYNSTKTDFSIYPNPVTGNTINIKLKNANLNEPYNVEIYSTLGIKVLSTKYKEKITLPDMSDGIYFVRLYSTNADKSFTKKIIIKK